jgi:uncharacterized alpha-E superfamily protein
MLSRVAARIYWMSRQIERAENMARILGVTSNMVLFGTKETREQNLLAPLTITDSAERYFEQKKPVTLQGLVDFLALDPGNPSSIYSCLRLARENAHAVRWQITSEMWESLNATWLEMRRVRRADVAGAGAAKFFDWVKDRSHLFRGVTYGTIMRGDAFNFSRLGTHLERADNTARILDVKYHTLLPSAADVGGAVDYYQWGALLRSVSGFESYRKIYSDVITPRRVAELLILREDMPRSLHASMNFIFESLETLCDQGSREVERAAGELHAKLHYGRTDDIIKQGLHEYLMDFLDRISALGEEISRHFLVPTY